MSADLGNVNLMGKSRETPTFLLMEWSTDHEIRNFISHSADEDDAHAPP